MPTPLSALEEKNKVRLNNIRAIAQEVLPQVAAVVLNHNQRNLEAAGSNPEDTRKLRKAVARTAANISFDIGEAFIDEWKKKRGGFKLEE